MPYCAVVKKYNGDPESVCGSESTPRFSHL